MAGEVTTFGDGAFTYIGDHEQAINDYASSLGLSATAIAGAMAKERDAYARHPDRNLWFDQRAQGNLFSHDVIVNQLSLVQGLGIADSSNLASKFLFSVLVDVGYGNFKFSTAIRLLEKYNTVWYPTSDPLDLKQLYNNDYRRLLTDLLNEDSPATAKFYGLMIKEADAFFAANVNADYWNNLSPEMKDALRITYTNFGMEKMEEKRDEGGGAGVVGYPTRPDLAASRLVLGSCHPALLGGSILFLPVFSWGSPPEGRSYSLGRSTSGE